MNKQKDSVIPALAGNHSRMTAKGASLKLAFCLLVLLLLVPNHLLAQPLIRQPAASYWRYPASGRLQTLVANDINNDGVVEFLVADENGNLDLVNANGERQWRYQAPNPILAFTAINLDGASQFDKEVVVAMPEQLVFLTATGTLIRQVRLASGEPVLNGEPRSDRTERRSGIVTDSRQTPTAVFPYDTDNDGNEEVLVILHTGAFQLYNQSGQLIWEFNDDDTVNDDATPHVVLDDFDQDGETEIVLGLFAARRFGQLIYFDNEERRWDLSMSGRITAVTPIQYGISDTPQIGVATSIGELHLFNIQRDRLWKRTLNKPITAMTPIQLPQGVALAVGTSAGTVVAYDHQGQRFWTQNLDPDAQRSILSLSGTAVSPRENQPALAVAIESELPNTGAADLVLLGSNRGTLNRFEGVDTHGLTRLIDINGDDNTELLLVRFATLELHGISVNTGKNASEWSHSLNAAPLSMLIVDFDNNGQEEVVIGTQNGRIHSLNNDGSLETLVQPGGAITHLATIPGPAPDPPRIAIVRNQTNQAEAEAPQSWLEIREANGEKQIEQQLDTPITSLFVTDIHPSEGSEIVIGTQNGYVHLFNQAGQPIWKHLIEENEPIYHLEKTSGTPSHIPEIIVGTRYKVQSIREINQSLVTRAMATYDSPIRQIHPIKPADSEELGVSLLIFVDDGQVYGLNWRGILMAHLPWPLALTAPSRFTVPTDQVLTEAFLENETAFIVATEENELLRIDVEKNRPIVSWQLGELNDISALHWDDRDGDALPDTAILGDQQGKVQIYNRIHTREPKLIAELDLFSSVFNLTSLQRGNNQNPDLLFITENGLVQLYRAQDNRPPLLTSPEVEMVEGQYSINLNVRDVENDTVRVRLELQDPVDGTWHTQSTKEVNSSPESLFWLVPEPLNDGTAVRYRFFYTDGLYEGFLTPPPGPPPLVVSPIENVTRYGIGAVGILSAIIFILFARQTRSPDARARRFYRRLIRQPQETLLMLENRYLNHDGAPDFLLNLANVARQEGNGRIASLADGLYLLSSRPRAGLSILTSTLDEINEQPEPWTEIERWQMIFKTGQELLEAPTITELSLLRPQFVELLGILEERGQYAPVLDMLLPVLTNLRDAERVDLVDDRLVYLNEATILLNRLQHQLSEFSARMERTLVHALASRWAGLISSTIEELRGRADLRVILKTKRLVPNGKTSVALEIQNNGRAPAENIMAVLDDNPAYEVLSLPQIITLLPSGRTRVVEFDITPNVSDRFRLSLGLTYDDRNQHDKAVAFGDMVHLLPPIRHFKPIINPYRPGTPLRPNSTLFFGREQLFNFIAENAGRRVHRNVLILVGQRRTGKTSALLRLDEHLPKQLLSVYIDCQSLGVIPGMPALLQEFAWLIADALAAHDIDIEVPSARDWQQEPTRLFQRTFLPYVRSLLPPNTTLLLVFDEFEAFENMVEDGILPPTFFTYLRHLMQHSEGLNFIFVGTRRLEEMTADYWSVLFNIALYRKIDYLDPAAATRLICEPVEPNLVYDDLALDKILRVTAGHPYFLQLVCYTLVKRANTERTGYITISDVNEAVDEMLRLGEVHFAYLWQRSSYVEKGILTAVSHLMERDNPVHPKDLIDFLTPYGILLTPSDITIALISLVERDIMREISDAGQTRYELKIGLVGLWVAQNKSLTSLHASQALEMTEVGD